MRCNNGKSGDIYGCPRTCTCTLYIAATTKWTVDRMGMLAHATTTCLWFNYMYMYLNMNVYHGTLLERVLQVTNRTVWSESIEEGGRTLASNMIQPHFATTFIHRTALACIEKSQTTHGLILKPSTVLTTIVFRVNKAGVGKQMQKMCRCNRDILCTCTIYCMM